FWFLKRVLGRLEAKCASSRNWYSNDLCELLETVRDTPLEPSGEAFSVNTPSSLSGQNTAHTATSATKVITTIRNFPFATHLIITWSKDSLRFAPVEDFQLDGDVPVVAVQIGGEGE